jgi:L-ascorbate metabolism protein UlaG (beta-lactamase superfamily)
LPTNSTTSLQHTDSAAPYLDARFYRAARLTGTNIVSGDHLATTNGDVIIHPLYHASLVMSWNGKTIYNDADDDPAYEFTYQGLPKADLILVNHSHGDHFSTTKIEALRGTNALIIAPQTVYSSLTAAQKTKAIVLNYGNSTNILGLTIEAVYAFNANHSPLGFGNGYVLTIGGKRIYLSGDTGDAPETRALTNMDVAFLCMNTPFTMTVNEATNAVRAFRPKVIYPYHYRDQSGATANAALFKQRLGTNLGIEVRLSKWY